MSDREDKIEREVLAHKLIAGTATQSERDNALATILLSLWTFADLRQSFESWHTDKCAECPAKKKAETGGMDGGWKEVAMMLLRYGGWIIIIVGSICGVKVNF